MLSEKFLERATRLIENHFFERRKQTPVEITKVKEEQAERNAFYSGMTISRIREICEREIEIRAVIVWQSLVRVLETLGDESSDDIAADLKQFMRESINSSFDELTHLLHQNLAKTINPQQVSLEQTRDHLIAKHEIEIDLYVDTRERRSEKNNASAGQSPTYQFYGNVGAVQTGPGALANIVQNLCQEDQEAMKQALSLARDAFAAAKEVAAVKRDELVEIVDEASDELERKNPNSTKLHSLFTTVATAIQTLASAQPAYQALKGALIPLGIMLP
jgi:hypothetical protein